MKIGDWEINAWVAAMFRLDGGAMFGVVPRSLWSRVAPPDDANRISMAMRALVVQGHDQTIVVDAGAGTGYGEKLENIYGFDSILPPAAGLEKLGIAPGDVTDVVITHLHFDHGGGAAVPAGDGWALAFPNAVHHVQRTQWEHALDPNPRDRASYFPDRIKLLESSGALALHDGEWTLAPGFDLHVCNGHTPGQQLPRVSGDGESIFYCGDLIPTSAHLPTPYVMSYDLNPVLAMEEKDRILERASRERWILFFEHDPDVAACRVDFDGKRFTPGERVAI